MSEYEERVPEVVLVETDNWQMIFVNGGCAYTGHRPSTKDVLSCLPGLLTKRIWVDEFPEGTEWVETLGNLPAEIIDEVEQEEFR